MYTRYPIVARTIGLAWLPCFVLLKNILSTYKNLVLFMSRIIKKLIFFLDKKIKFREREKRYESLLQNTSDHIAFSCLQIRN